MRMDSTFYVRNISVQVNIAKKTGDMHAVEILAEREGHKEYVLKNYPCELSSNAAINVSSNERDNKIKVVLLKDAKSLEECVICFEFFVDGTGYLNYHKEDDADEEIICIK